MPVNDLLTNFSTKILQNRCFSNKKIIKKLSNFCINVYRKKKIGTVIKHIPGHGKAKTDSHKFLPIVKTNKRNLFKEDFNVFKNKSLTLPVAHILYKI